MPIKAVSLLLLGLLLLALPACRMEAGEGLGQPSAPPTAGIEPELVLQRLCIAEGGERGVHCSTFHFIDASMPGWQEFINSILPAYYGLPTQDYISLVTYLGETFVAQTYGDLQTPVYAQQARSLSGVGVTACYPTADSQDAITVMEGCEAAAVLIPRTGVLSVDGASAFPKSEYMSEIFGHLGSITTGIPEHAMRAALEAVLP